MVHSNLNVFYFTDLIFGNTKDIFEVLLFLLYIEKICEHLVNGDLENVEVNFYIGKNVPGSFTRLGISRFLTFSMVRNNDSITCIINSRVKVFKDF